jgi:hypothetical protein
MLEQESIKEGIIKELSKGDRFAGELKDALGIQKYPVLWTAIASLQFEKKVEYYFKPTKPIETLTYRLSTSENTSAPSSPIPPWGTKL